MHATTIAGTISSSNLEMPNFKLPSFDGQYQKLTPFYEQFMASVSGSTTPPDIQKFDYLKSSLVGEAYSFRFYLYQTRIT